MEATENELMNVVFTSKHWKIFLFFLLLSFLQSMSRGLYDPLDAIFYSIYIIAYIGWLLVLGLRLRKISPAPAMNYRLFLTTGVVLTVAVISFRFLVLFKPGFLGSFNSISIVLAMMAYILVSLSIMASFVAKNLKIIEVGDDIDINDYFGDMLGLIFWPVGIWTFQPRINRLSATLTNH